jgi:tetraacyldisaccharide 4'-kinase
MRAPDFWRSDGLTPRLLDPLGQVYGLIGRLRRRLASPRAASVPVICVGNLTAGGAGKTPAAIAIAARLKAAGERPHLLTRGYGGRIAGPERVDLAVHDAKEVGDEALLLARTAPTWVAKDRVLGADAAARAGASVIILDDGHQNPHLAHDLAFVVIDGAAGFGNNRLLPAGPLRETVEDGLARADALIVIGGGGPAIASSLPRLKADFQAAPGAPDLVGKRILAFAGIGRPQKFFETVQGLGAVIVDARPFPDHYRYKPSEIEALLAQARQVDASCLTTEKDHVRIPLPLGNSVKKLPIELRFENDDALDELLESALAGKVSDIS